MEDKKLNIIDNIVNMLSGAKEEVQEVIEETVEEIKEEVSEAVDVVEEAVEDVVDVVEDAVEEVKDIVEEAVEEISDVDEEVSQVEITNAEPKKLDRYEVSKELIKIGITDTDVMDQFMDILESDDKSAIIQLVGKLSVKKPGQVLETKEEVKKTKAKVTLV